MRAKDHTEMLIGGMSTQSPGDLGHRILTFRAEEGRLRNFTKCQVLEAYFAEYRNC